MPELPEVETILRGIVPRVKNQCIRRIIIRQKSLRWVIPSAITEEFINQPIYDLKRRGKYLLLFTQKGTAILHFGMSGSLSLLPKQTPPNKHDHFDFIFDDFCLRFTDPRRFGALLWTRDDPMGHPLLAHLGKEPLEPGFTAAYLYKCAKNRKIGIKQFIMNSTIVVGVGNIYAAEALFLAKINPLKPSQALDLTHFEQLVVSIKKVLKAAIKQGGTTLRDFLNSAGKPGYFKLKLNVYGREGLACNQCGTCLKKIVIQNRSTVYCPYCQAL
ncbi:MAG: bifunctional DNA-formamidopyrimidine glycosylase/DNA-(apurinic or apyrimidinic site) lyase [Gammaproteobacteria bacterium]|nr:bifunctional DNA-formamidopyrimidine glycosylase/DNA-(apurinic or apyrimidinic site) lyase [Gammaproteobacteria bacterium]